MSAIKPSTDKLFVCVSVIAYICPPTPIHWKGGPNKHSINIFQIRLVLILHLKTKSEPNNITSINTNCYDVFEVILAMTNRLNTNASLLSLLMRPPGPPLLSPFSLSLGPC